MHYKCKGINDEQGYFPIHDAAVQASMSTTPDQMGLIQSYHPGMLAQDFIVTMGQPQIQKI
jgi:hypothetical protein